jgi:hypothetical protein
MSTVPNQRAVQYLTWSAQAFFYGRDEMGYVYFADVAQNSPQDADGVYESICRIREESHGDSRYGMKAFHDLDDLWSAPREKAQAIKNYLLTKNILIKPTESPGLNHKLVDGRL